LVSFFLEDWFARKPKKNSNKKQTDNDFNCVAIKLLKEKTVLILQVQATTSQLIKTKGKH